MLKYLKNGIANRDLLIGRPRLTLKDKECKNITCRKKDQFKHYKDNLYICECGYILEGEFEIEQQHKMKFYCKSSKCPENKNKMDANCLKCQFIGEK